MAFDWTKLEGYRDDMTADEKLALLDKVEDTPAEPPKEEPATPKPSGSVVSKSQFDKVSSELAALKKQMRSRMSEDEQKELDRKASEDAMREELETLRKEKTYNAHKASFMAQGYDEKLADEAANAMTEGDSDGVFNAMRKFQQTAEQKLRAKILKDTPVPPASDKHDEDAKLKEEMNQLRNWFGLPQK